MKKELLKDGIEIKENHKKLLRDYLCIFKTWRHKSSLSMAIN